MNLCIMGQDKESLTETSNIQYSFINDKHVIATYYDNLKVLGIYKSKERALEVLDEIKNIIYFNRLFNADISVFKECLEDEFKMSTEEMNVLLRKMSVYEMPKE